MNDKRKIDARESQIGVVGDGARVEGGIHFHAAPSGPGPESGAGVDFVIVTALEEERDAVLDKLPGHRQQMPSEEDIRVYYSAQLPVTFPDGSRGAYSLVVMPLLGMGRAQASTATGDAIRRWRPRYVLLVGIAGGVAESGVRLGDLLISDQIVDYELQKLTPEGPQVRWEVFRADPRMVNAARNFRGAGWQELLTVARPGEARSSGSRQSPTRHVGPIASGDKVIASADVLARYREQWPKLVGVEMEAAGVAIAAHQAASRPGVFMVRGVSDLADADKGTPEVERWRAYACDVAAAYALALLRSGPVVPRGGEGPEASQAPGGVQIGGDVHGDGSAELAEDLVTGSKTTMFDQRGQTVGQQINVAGDYRAGSSGAGPSGKWNSEAIRRLLMAAFSDGELTTLCFDHFYPVYEAFGSGMGKGDKVQRLLEYCVRQGQVERLLAQVKARNPAQYARFEGRLA